MQLNWFPLLFLCCSQSLSTLTVIEEFLAKRPVPPSPKTSSQDRPGQNWVRNLNYYSKCCAEGAFQCFLVFAKSLMCPKYLEEPALPTTDLLWLHMLHPLQSQRGDVAEGEVTGWQNILSTEKLTWIAQQELLFTIRIVWMFRAGWNLNWSAHLIN